MLQQILAFSAMNHQKWEAHMSCGHSVIFHGFPMASETTCYVCEAQYKAAYQPGTPEKRREEDEPGDD